MAKKKKKSTNVNQHKTKPPHEFSLDVGEVKPNRNGIKICPKW